MVEADTVIVALGTMPRKFIAETTPDLNTSDWGTFLVTEETGATVDVTDDGIIKIFSVDKAAGENARKRIELITADVEVGTIYEGKVARLMDFGAFVTILPGRDGLVHISQICEERVEKVSDKLSEGDVIKVKVLEVDKQGRIRLSMKAIAEGEG